MNNTPQIDDARYYEYTDQEIINALRAVIKAESIITEPTSAAVYAALPKLSIETQY